MTWKRELAFWSFMFLAGIFVLYAILATGVYVSDHIPMRMAAEAGL